MTDRPLSPTAANAQAKKAAKNRYKLARLDKPVDPPREFACRVHALFEDASKHSPGEWSPAYAEYVIDQFADLYVELSRVAPLKAGAR